MEAIANGRMRMWRSPSGTRLGISQVSYPARSPPWPAGEDDEQGGGDNWTFSAAVLPSTVALCMNLNYWQSVVTLPEGVSKL